MRPRLGAGSLPKAGATTAMRASQLNRSFFEYPGNYRPFLRQDIRIGSLTFDQVSHHFILHRPPYALILQRVWIAVFLPFIIEKHDIVAIAPCLLGPQQRHLSATAGRVYNVLRNSEA